MQTKFTPENLKRWTRPSCYMGAEWPDYFSSGVGQSRDSDALERSNFDAMLKALGGEQSDKEREDPEDEGAALSLVRVIPNPIGPLAGWNGLPFTKAQPMHSRLLTSSRVSWKTIL